MNTALKPFLCLINGQFIKTSATIDVVNPATGKVITSVPDIGKDELDQAVTAAQNAFPAWSQRTIAERKELLNQLIEKIKNHSDELIELLTLELGRPLFFSSWEVKALTEQYGPQLLAQDYTDETSRDTSIGKVTKQYVPLGVVCAISAWNAPVMLSYLKAFAALVTGNTIVLKPSPFTPLAVLRIAELSKGIIPDGVLNVITGGDNLGPLMTSHTGFRKITFTGSTPTGKSIMKSAAATLSHLTLELGGNDAGIVLPDAEPEKIAEELFWRMFVLSGQGCITLKRLYVHESLYPSLTKLIAEYAAKVKMGDGFAEDSQLGPVQNILQYHRIQEIWKNIQASNAKVLFQGTAPNQGYFFPVTILDNPADDESFTQQEIFGPIRSIFSYKDIDEAVQRANNSPYGLGASVWGNDEATLQEVANRLNAGTVWINQHMEVAGDVAFGGIKDSGVGVEFGIEGLRAFCDIKIIAEKISTT